MQILKKKLTKDLDVSSPPNSLLDTESLGLNTRTTNFIIAPQSTRLSDVIHQFSNDQPVNLVANLIHRAMTVIEEPEFETRSLLRSEFQSELFTSAQQLFLKNNFSLFAFYNRRTIDEISTKIQPKKFDIISSLITQPLLRLAVQNKAIYIDPNAVIRIAGIEGFKKIADLFLIQFWNLEPKMLDTFLSSFFTKKGQPQFDMVRVWMLIASSENQLNTPIVPKSKWTLEKFLKMIIAKQSESILKELFQHILRSNNVSLLNEIVYFCRSTHSITGSLKYPWAVQVIDDWISSESRVFCQIDTIRGQTETVSICRREETELSTPSDHPWDARTIMIDSHETLMELKKVLNSIPEKSFVGISFPAKNIVSISFDDFAYVIDLVSVEPRFVSYILKRLLNDRSCVKVVFNLSKFLGDIQHLIGDSVHFENVVEIRGTRVRKRLGSSQDVEKILTSAFCPGVEGIDQQVVDSHTVNQVCEWFTESRTSNLRELSKSWLGIDHDRKACFEHDQWDIRLLPEEFVRVAANDSRVLVMLETRWREEGIVPVETLSFDPFENS